MVPENSRNDDVFKNEMNNNLSLTYKSKHELIKQHTHNPGKAYFNILLIKLLITKTTASVFSNTFLRNALIIIYIILAGIKIRLVLAIDEATVEKIRNPKGKLN